MFSTKTLVLLLASLTLPLLCNSCMQQTVRDAQGNIIYQEPVVGTPWQSEATTRKQVEKHEQELGWR